MVDALDNTNQVPVIAFLLSQNDTIRGLVDSQIIPGLRSEPADEYLQKANQTCIGVSEVSEESAGTVGVKVHGRTDFSSVFQLTVISKQSSSYAMQIGKACRNLFTGEIATIYEGENFYMKVQKIGRANFFEPKQKLYYDIVSIYGIGFYWM